MAAKLVELNHDLIITEIDMSENCENGIDSYIIRSNKTIKLFTGNKKYNSHPEFRGVHGIKDIIDSI